MGTFKYLITVLIFGMMLAVRNVCCIDVEEYFPEVTDDLGVVTWAHAVNNKAFLQESLLNDIMMLEADVLLGFVTSGKSGSVSLRIPIMAHPPAVTSDLSLQNFLQSVVNATSHGARKGIKLDFKSLDVLDAALTELEEISSQITFPVWLNADILQGPVESTSTPVKADEFLAQCKERFPTSTLSTGWTTRFGLQSDGTNITEGSYTPSQVDEMTNIIKNHGITQPVTFPVRAGIAAHSSDELMRLVTNTWGSTLTLWSPESDPVDVPALRKVIDRIGRDKIYIDVPEELREALMSSTVVNVAIAPLVALLTGLVTLIL